MESMRFIAGLILILLVAFGAAYVITGRSQPPVVNINQPAGRFIGQGGALDVTAEAPNAVFSVLNVVIEQNGKTLPVFSLNDTNKVEVMTPVDRNQVRITRALGKLSLPQLQQGPAKLIVTASRQSAFNLHTLTTTATKDLQVRLEPPRITVVSTHHYVNHGGSEMVVYRATPSDVASGVRVGTIEYPGFAASGAGVNSPDLKIAFFALLYNQPLHAPIVAFARDEAGNEATATFVDNVFEKPFKKSRIDLNDDFVGRVVPEIIQHSPELKMESPSGDLMPAFLRINGELRRTNAAKIAAFAKGTSPTRMWQGPFVQLGNSQVEARFADQRTYFYKGKDVDQQVHLGFDLAVTANVPVVAANAGTVIHTDWLGIYGNCIVIDHGMGVQSLYGHLSSFEVKPGDMVQRGQEIGRSGMTGLAGGDHLHFTMLVGGQMVNPVEWWDAHWVADRVDRKLGEAH
jgi:murein DD-endopeptidase MepM/ murein hydrolase activator NlpD